MPLRITALLLTLIALSQPTYALRFYVNPTTGDDRRSVQSAQDTSTAFKTITHALRIAHIVQEGRPHVIELSSGTYSPSMGETFPLHIAQPGIYIKANGQTVFDGEGKSNFFDISAPTSDFTIQGIDFYNGASTKGGVAYCNTCSLRVTNNRFFRNRSSQGGHIVYSENGRLKFYNNLVRDSGNGADTVAVIELRNTFTDTTTRDEIRNNIFYRNPSPNIWTASPRTYISSNMFIGPEREAIRNASDSAVPLIGHNLFWETGIFYTNSQEDSVQIQRADRDTVTFSAASISLPPVMKNAPDVRTLTFRSDTLSLSDLNVRLPSFVTNAPDTLIQVGKTHQYLIGLSGPTYQFVDYTFKTLQLPEGAEIQAVDGVPRLVLWSPTLNDTTSHPISFQITNPAGIVDTLSYNLDVFTGQTFPDTTNFRALRDENGRLSGMYTEVRTVEVPHVTDQPYLFDISVSGSKSLYVFTPLALPSGASESQAQQGIIDWFPTRADTGRSHVSMEIIDPSGNADTLQHDIYVFTPETFPDTSLAKPLITVTLTPDTTGALSALNALEPTFSSANSATGNLFTNPVVLDTTVNRFELMNGLSPAIDAGSPVVALIDGIGGKNRNDIGFYGGPINGGVPTPNTTFSEVNITSLPDSVAVEGQLFTYNPTLSPNARIDLIDLIADVPGSSVPPTMGPYNPFGRIPPIQWTPTLADTGSYLIGVRVITSNSSGRHYFPLRVRPINELPYLTAAADTTALEDELYSYAIQANDANGDTLTYALVSGPEGMSVDSLTGIVTWSPTQDELGTYAVSIRIEDGKGGSSLHDYTLVVSNTNDAPAIQSTPDTTATEDALFSYAVSASDPDPVDTLSYALINGPTGASIDNSGLLTWMPTQQQVGVQSFVLAVSDRDSATVTQEFSVRVDAFDDFPVIAATPDTIATEDNLYSFDLQASDEEGGPIQYALFQRPSGMTIDSTGVLTWTPTAQDVGSYSVEARATDPAGQTTTLSYTLSVRAVNDAPLINRQAPANPSVYNPERDAISFYVSASDEEGDPLSFSWLINGTLRAEAKDSTLSYSPATVRVDTVVARVSDADTTTEFTWYVDSRSIPRLTLDNSDGDFGYVAIGDTAQVEIALSNEGEVALQISSLQVDDLRFAATFGSVSLGPGQSTTLTLRYTPNARGTNADTIRFASNDPDNATIRVPVSGTGTVATNLSLDLDTRAGDQSVETASVRPGDSLRVALYARRASALQTYQIQLNFNPEILHFVQFAPDGDDETNLLRSEGISSTYSAQLAANETVTLNGSIATIGITGDGLLGIAVFAIDSEADPGSTTITVDQAILNSHGESQSDTLRSLPTTTLDILPALLGDFDLDRDVDFDDFFIFADSFGQTDFNPITDLNGDRAVTFDDFFIFSDNFGTSIAGKQAFHPAHVQAGDLLLNIEHATPEELIVTPRWQGKDAMRGYVLSLSFDPAVLRFEQYVGRAEQTPLPWIVESTPGRLILATGLASAQRDFSGTDLGRLYFTRISGEMTKIQPTMTLVRTTNRATMPSLPPILTVDALPTTFVLYPAHPNPFNPSTSISFYAPRESDTSLRVYDLLGRIVYTLVSKRIDAGYHTVTWNGTDDDGRPVGSGVYLVEMRAQQWRQIQKITLLK
jgi:hypothetical protein